MKQFVYQTSVQHVSQTFKFQVNDQIHDARLITIELKVTYTGIEKKIHFYFLPNNSIYTWKGCKKNLYKIFKFHTLIHVL